MNKLIISIFAILLLSIQLFSEWSQISTVNTTQLNAVKFFNEWTGITAGVGGIWRSTNSGVNWAQVLTSVNINSISFPDNNTGYAVGDSGKIYQTTDNGLNWIQRGIGITTKKLNGVSFPSSNGGWAVGESGKILYTFNGGNSFVTQTTGDSTQDINYIHMVNSTTGYLCGSSNAETFVYTPNGGINWLFTLFLSGNTLNAVSYIPASNSNALAVGTNGRIRRTTTNGTSWALISSPVSAQLNHVVFLDANTGYIAGNSGNILKTTNSGFNWVVDAIITLNNLRSLSFINASTAWAVGSNGVIIRQGIPVGIIQTENEEPKDFKLYQNYPNPFNPTTIIAFELPENNFIRLVIYDVLGNEVITLVNGEKRPGRYEIIFDGSFLASGIYLNKAEFTNISENSGQRLIEFKKMVLMK